MTANPSMRSLRRAALGAMVLAMAFPALADEPDSQTRLVTTLERLGAYPLADAELETLRGAGLFSDALAAVINNVPQGYTAMVQVGGTTVCQTTPCEIGSSTPQTIPQTTIGGTTFKASATNTGPTPTPITFSASTTSTTTRTFSFSWPK